MGYVQPTLLGKRTEVEVKTQDRLLKAVRTPIREAKILERIRIHRWVSNRLAEPVARATGWASHTILRERSISSKFQ